MQDCPLPCFIGKTEGFTIQMTNDEITTPTEKWSRFGRIAGQQFSWWSKMFGYTDSGFSWPPRVIRSPRTWNKTTIHQQGFIWHTWGTERNSFCFPVLTQKVDNWATKKRVFGIGMTHQSPDPGSLCHSPIFDPRCKRFKNFPKKMPWLTWYVSQFW